MIGGHGHGGYARLAIGLAAVFAAGGLVQPPLGLAQPQSPAQVRCLTNLLKRATKLVKVHGKELDRCVYELTRNGGNATACMTADPKGKVAKAAQKVLSTEAKYCAEAPDFGYAGAADLISAARGHRTALVEWTTTIGNLDSTQATCGRLYLKSQAKLLDRKLRGVGECLGDGLADSSIQSAAHIVDCFSRLASSSDPDLSKILDSLAAKMAKKGCGHFCFTAPTLSGCAEQGTSCRGCQVLRIGGGLTVDCDLLDDGTANGLCATTCGDGEVGAVPPSAAEECDDGNRISGDGCDSNCTVSGCGNEMPAADEFCDVSDYGSLLGGVCIGGAYDGFACSWNADCGAGYCTSCPNRYNCAPDCSACGVPQCVMTASGCELLTGACFGSFCGFFPPIDCEECASIGNCTIDGYCVPTTAEACAEYEGVSGSCTIGF